MENHQVKHNFHFKNNNSFIYINNTPKVLRISKTPIMNLDKKKKNTKLFNNSNTNEKQNIKKKPYTNLNFNLIQNKNMNCNKIRTITPNLKLREIVNKKFRDNNYNYLQNFNNVKCKTELPEIINRNHSKNQNISFIHTEANYKKKDSIENMDRQLKLIFVMKNKINELNKIIKEKNQEINNLKSNVPINNNYSTININNIEKNKNISEDKNLNTFNNIEAKIENKRMSKEKSNNINKNENNRNRNNKKDNNNYNNNTYNSYYNNNNNSNYNNINNYNNNSIYNNNNNSNYTISSNYINNSINRLTPIKKNNTTTNNNNNNEIDKLNREVQYLNKIITSLDEKYQQEIKKNNEFNQKYNYIKNCTFGINVPTVQAEEKIRNYENKIIDLEEQIFQLKQKEEKSKERIILSNEEYANVQICLNALLIVYKVKEEDIMDNIKDISLENKEKIANSICHILKISNNILMTNFINDFLIKNKKNNLHPTNFGGLMKYNVSNNNFINNELIPFIKERSSIYDFEKKGVIPFIYLRHLYNEFCFKNYKERDEKELFIIVYTCKNVNTSYNLSNSIFDIYYNNLITNEYDIKEAIANEELAENERAVKQFIDSIMKEEIEKLKQRKKEKEREKKEKKKEKNINSKIRYNNQISNSTYNFDTNLNVSNGSIV